MMMINIGLYRMGVVMMMMMNIRLDKKGVMMINIGLHMMGVMMMVNIGLKGDRYDDDDEYWVA